MAIIPESEFIPVQRNASSSEYPQGSAKDVSGAGVADGTPPTANVFNDIWGLLQRLLDDAGIIPSGDPDTILASDYKDALDALFATLTHNHAGMEETKISSTGLDTGAVVNSTIAAGAVTGGVGGKIGEETITSYNLADGAVSAARLADNSVTAEKVVEKRIMSRGYSTGQTFTGGGGDETITFDAESFDYGGGFNPATGIFTVPAASAGVYQVRAVVQWNTMGEDVVLGIKHGGTTVAQHMLKNQSGTASQEVTTLVDAAVGDEILAFANIGGAGSDSINGGASISYFEIIRLPFSYVSP